MINSVIRFLGGDPHKREIQRGSQAVERINELEKPYEELSDDALLAKTEEFRARLAEGETLDDLLPEAFAAVREASKRTIGLRHYDVQLIGGLTLHAGRIAEMRTGEGKTLVATLPLYLNALTGRGVHLVTVNDYLARRDARWMAPIYQALGMSVGVLQMAARTDNGRNAFLVDLEKTSNHEDQHQLRTVLRRQAYEADITYGTNSEYGFDYLRDNLTLSLEERVQRGHYYAIVDEVDNILIDEARTPLIISGPAQDESEWYYRMFQVVRQLRPEDYEINEKDRTVSLTEIGEANVEEILDMPLRDPERPEDITPEQARMLGYLEQALRAQFLYRRNKDYLVQGGKVIIVDEFTGRLMPGRRWSEGLHQAVEAKEGVKVEPENVTYATITLQNYFRMYEKLAGMTGTAETEAEEFSKIYKLDVLPIPTNLEFIAMQKESPLITVEARDEQGYKYLYYAQRGDPDKKPIFWKRKDFPDVVYRTAEAKLRAITKEIIHYHIIGRPQLVGTTSVEHSEILSNRLDAEPIRRLAQVLLIHQSWLDANHTDIIASAVPELQPLNRPLTELSASDLRQAIRSLGYDLSLNLEDSANLETLLRIFKLQEEHLPRLIKVIQGGVSHQVLNARKHDEEAMIIARAGAFGAVTIATNMAGRGVDIKLGGELPEEILRDTNRVLGRVADDPYDMTDEERYQALKAIPPENYGIYEESVNTFLQHVDDMKRVRELGGLHVIGSERHEARRIDNQLRGRSARQGDPGSSRFYLSLEDELMRLFGGQQVETLWKRMFFDESQPIEMNILGRLVEQSQERVEGSNFDVRKHLLEYDDVLNMQRKRIYSQRDRAFTKPDLTEDILEMLRTELQERVPAALKDDEGPWKLLAYLDEIQPPFEYENITQPSFAARLIIDEARQALGKNEVTRTTVQAALLEIAGRALQAEQEHQLRSARAVLEHTEESLKRQIEERKETLDTYLEGIRNEDEETRQAAPRRPQEMVNELSELVRVPLRLNNEQLRLIGEGSSQVTGPIRQQIEDALISVNVNRLVGAFERRLGEPLAGRLKFSQRPTWDEISDQILSAVEEVFNQRHERLLGKEGQIEHDLEGLLNRVQGEPDDRQWLSLLLATTQGVQTVFDRRTHRRTQRQFNRLNYVYLAARLLQDSDSRQVTQQVLEHLEDALERLQMARGMVEWNRLVQIEATLRQLDERRQERLQGVLGFERFEELSDKALQSFNPEDRQTIIEELGRALQNEVYRELLLRVISEQWVDYLTRVEALRVEIGLEAYAQRDPLVQYKGRASEMFQNLLAEIRMGVIGRLYTYQGSRAVAASLERERPEVPAGPPAGAETRPISQAQGQKKKRHRH